MARVMVFIDGDWLLDSLHLLAGSGAAGDLSLDFAILPRALGVEAAQALDLTGAEVVRTFLYAKDIEKEEQTDADSRRERFALLREDHHYEALLFPTEREGGMALIAELFYYAALPGALDVAVVVAGDRDHLPALRLLRRLGKRVVIASIKDACDREYTDPSALAGVVDAGIVWLNDIVPRIELRAEKRQLECLSPLHQGPRKVWSDFRPRAGRPFYCDECRRRFAEQHQSFSAQPEPTGDPLPGEICKVVREKGYGFIRGVDGREFFFHLSDLTDIEWDTADIGMMVTFLVKREPEPGRAGAAGRVLRSADATPSIDPAAAPTAETENPVTVE